MCDEAPGIGCEEDQGGGAVLIRIHVPDLNIHKCLQFYRQDLVWDVKQACLASLPKELKESFNYGLFAPPCNGKVGKFLDEERPLSDYPFSGPVGYLELRYKRKLYKGLHIDEKQLKSLHTKSNLKRFLEHVYSANTEKVTKMCGKGLDPNFHCPESGETPLSIAAIMKKPSKLLIALVNGGALLDYRSSDGSTAMHRAVEAKSLEAVKTLLELGGSPNYKDGKSLTPLYLSVSANADPALCEALLHDHAYLGAQDQQGWHETHQACRNGLIHHLEHLLYYGADMNAKNASGNTPLHVCAVNNQEICARLLLFRGADKEALNFANQSPYQVAVIAGNMELAETIQEYRPQDVVPYRDLPKFNPLRRGVIYRAYSDKRIAGSNACISLNRQRSSQISLTESTKDSGIPPPIPSSKDSTSSCPPSPCPSNRSLPAFSSASSSMSECSASTNPTSSCSHHGGSSCYSDSSYSEGSSHFASEETCDSALTDKSLDHSDITSDSSGVGTCNSGGSASSYDATPTDGVILPGMMVVCVENYAPQSTRHLKLTEGDIIEVTASTDRGLLEGSLRGQMGIFPAFCVQEMRVKGYESRTHVTYDSSQNSGGKKVSTSLTNGKQFVKSRVKKIWGEPHTVILHRGQKGFGFVLRGAKSDSPLMELQPSDRFPALQYLDDVDVNGVADRAGLRKGDFILAINGVDVSQSSHESVVDFIRKSGDLVSMTVVGLSFPLNLEQENSKPGSPASLTCDSGGTPKAQYSFATLPRKSSGSSGPTVPSPPRRDPTTSLSVGRARAKSMVAALTDLDGPNNIPSEVVSGIKSNSADSIAGKPPLPVMNGSASGQGKTASIRARPTSSRITASEIQDIFLEKIGNRTDDERLSPGSSGHKIYASVSEMKRSKAKEVPALHKDFHSTPDLNDLIKNKDGTITVVKKVPEEKRSRSQEGLNKSKSNPRHSWACSNNLPAARGIELNNVSGWKKIENVGRKRPTESEGSLSSSDSSGEETSRSTIKTPLPVESEYRTIKPLRPIQSKTLPRRASTGCASIAPFEQQTIINLVPPGQVIKVDISKSKEYASLDINATLTRRDNSVMSSFKPTDSAKLYASPDDLKSIGYRELGGSGHPAVPEGEGTLTFRKPCRSMSVPRGSHDENSINRSIKRDYALPTTTQEGSLGQWPTTTNGSHTKDNHESCQEARSSDRRSNDGNEADTSFDPQKSLQEAKERLRPVLKTNSSAGSLSCSTTSANDSTKIRIEVKQSPRLARKAEKTVTFQSEMSNNSANATSGGQMSHSLSVDEFQKVKSSLKISKSVPNDLGGEDGHEGEPSNCSGVGLNSEGNNYVTSLSVNPDSDSSEDASDKTWTQKEENVPNTTRKMNNAASQGQSQVNNQSTVFLNNSNTGPAENGSNTSARSVNARNASATGTLTKNAVSLVKLPPPMELESESEDRSPHTTPILKTTHNHVNISGGGGSNVAPVVYHTLQPQRSKPMLQDQMTNRQQHQYGTPVQMQVPRQAEKSIEESIKLIRMHVEALKQDFPNVTPPPPMSQTPILAPPPEFSDARDTHESATRFNHVPSNHGSNQSDQLNQNTSFNRQSPLYRSISHTHSSNTSMYSGYPTMTRQQYQLQQQQQQHHLQQQQQQQQARLAQQQKQQYGVTDHSQLYSGMVPAQHQQMPNAHSLHQQHQQVSMPVYHTLGRPVSSTNAQSLLNNSAYGHYQTLTSVKQQQQLSTNTAQSHGQNLYQHQHHPKCHYYQQTSASAAPNTSTNPVVANTKYIPEKLHPVHRYTPDIYESTGPRIVGAIPKKQVGVTDHYEIPHAHQQQLQQKSLPYNPQQDNSVHQQQQQQANRIVRREFRNKALPDWSVGDTCDWLESLFMPEYKVIFQQRQVDGKRLLRMDNANLLELGVKKLGHRMNIEKSLKRYLPQPKT